MIKALKIRTKLLAVFLLIGLAPLGAVTYLSLHQAGSALQNEVWDKFAAIQKVKKHHIESHFKQMRAALRITRNDPYIQNALWIFKGALEASFGEIDSDEFRKQAGIYDPRIQTILADNGWVDLYLITDAGKIAYTVAKQADLGQDLMDGQLKETGLGTAFGTLVNAGDDAVIAADFQAYAPANGRQAAFMATKMKSRNGSVIGILAVQLGFDQINAIVQQRTGMGATGESYLVGRLHGDVALRSDRVVKAGKAGDPKSDPFIEKALAGDAGGAVKTGSSGAKEFVRYDPLDIEGFSWAMLTTAAVDEMLASVSQLRSVIIMVIFIAMGLIVALAMWVTGKITRPINSAVTMLKDIAEGEGDLTKRLAIESKDEIGQLGGWFNVFMEKLQGLIRDIAADTATLTESSSSLSAIATQMAGGAETMCQRTAGVAEASENMSDNMNGVAAASEEAATNVQMVAASAEEMTATVQEIAQNAEKARHVTETAVEQVAAATSRVGELGQAASQISKVTEVITEISEQTNLLALNATIEAARAGEAGKGFAVVANEIKDLARQTAEATQEIKSHIAGIQGSTTATVDQIEQISGVIHDVNTVVVTIATAVEEQTATSQEIAGNVSQASHGLQEVSENVGQSTLAANTISTDITAVNQASHEASAASGQVNANAEGLSNLADRLHTHVNRFKI